MMRDITMSMRKQSTTGWLRNQDYVKDSRLRMARGLKQRCLTEQMCSILITETVDNIPTQSMMNMETAAMKELDDIITTNMEEGQEDDMYRQLVVVEVEADWSQVMEEFEEEPYKIWLARELSEMGMGLEMQPGGCETAPEIVIILEQQRAWLERQPENETWWLGKWKNEENTENNGNTVTSSTSGVGRGKNKLELGHNQLGSKCNTQTTPNQNNWNNISRTLQSCQPK